jgi:hypothetical protein
VSTHICRGLPSMSCSGCMEDYNRAHVPMPVNADADGPAEPDETIRIVCSCAEPGCQRFAAATPEQAVEHAVGSAALAGVRLDPEDVDRLREVAVSYLHCRTCGDFDSGFRAFRDPDGEPVWLCFTCVGSGVSEALGLLTDGTPGTVFVHDRVSPSVMLTDGPWHCRSCRTACSAARQCRCCADRVIATVDAVDALAAVVYEWDTSGEHPIPAGATACPWCSFWHMPGEPECVDAPREVEDVHLPEGP